jgi:hypothetical protein
MDVSVRMAGVTQQGVVAVLGIPVDRPRTAGLGAGVAKAAHRRPCTRRVQPDRSPASPASAVWSSSIRSEFADSERFQGSSAVAAPLPPVSPSPSPATNFPHSCGWPTRGPRGLTGPTSREMVSTTVPSASELAGDRVRVRTERASAVTLNEPYEDVDLVGFVACWPEGVVVLVEFGFGHAELAHER